MDFPEPISDFAERLGIAQGPTCDNFITLARAANDNARSDQ